MSGHPWPGLKAGSIAGRDGRTRSVQQSCRVTPGSGRGLLGVGGREQGQQGSPWPPGRSSRRAEPQVGGARARGRSWAACQLRPGSSCCGQSPAPALPQEAPGLAPCSEGPRVLLFVSEPADLGAGHPGSFELTSSRFYRKGTAGIRRCTCPVAQCVLQPSGLGTLISRGPFWCQPPPSWASSYIRHRLRAPQPWPPQGTGRRGALPCPGPGVSAFRFADTQASATVGARVGRRLSDVPGQLVASRGQQEVSALAFQRPGHLQGP